jgi:thiol-disulfide isomerase/thioredoxin
MVGLSGQTVEHLTNYAGKVVVLEFWATWCAPCQKQVAALQSYADRYPGWKDKVVLIAASVDESEGLAGTHVRAKGWNKTHNVWTGIEAIKAYHISRVPTIYLVDQRGRIAGADFEGAIPEIVNRLLHEE